MIAGRGAETEELGAEARKKSGRGSKTLEGDWWQHAVGSRLQDNRTVQRLLHDSYRVTAARFGTVDSGSDKKLRSYYLATPAGSSHA